jgi:hypothetical protein
MKHFACYVHLPGVASPHLRFVTCENRDGLPNGVSELVREWPHFERIDVCDEEGRLLSRFTQEDAGALPVAASQQAVAVQPIRRASDQSNAVRTGD